MRELEDEFAPDAAGVGMEDDDAIGEADGFADGVGDEEDGTAGFDPEILEVLVKRSAGLCVQGGEGFVHEEDGGVHDECAGDGDSLAHAAGEFVYEFGGAAGEVNHFENGGDAVAAFGEWDAGHFEAELDVLFGGEPGE